MYNDKTTTELKIAFSAFLKKAVAGKKFNQKKYQALCAELSKRAGIK